MIIIKQKQYLLRQYANYLFSMLSPMVKEVRVFNNDIEIKTTPNNLRSLLFFLKCHTLTQYKQLVDIVCSDVPGKMYRFTVAYLLHSLLYNARIVIIVKTNEVIAIPSVIQLYESAG
jgi:NADH dehydrogenase (ubiquinone) Fe-S protein 3